MMKRKIALIISISLFAVLIGATIVYAAEMKNQESSNFIESMHDFMRYRINNAQKEGQLTQEEAAKWNRHFDDMERYHKENGLLHCGNFKDKTLIPSTRNYGPRPGKGMMHSFNNGGMMHN